MEYIIAFFKTPLYIFNIGDLRADKMIGVDKTIVNISVALSACFGTSILLESDILIVERFPFISSIINTLNKKKEQAHN